jgi:hypothetical protein
MRSSNRIFSRLPAVALVLTMAVPALFSPAESLGGHRFPERTVLGDVVDVQVLVEGEATPLYVAPGREDRSYFQAFRGRNYSLVVRNTTGGRVGVLIAVDGLNVVDGERSSLSNTEAMYVLDPYERAEIRGWRTSLHDVRKFVFVDEERSYAERSGKANGDMGWIRVLSFREAGQPWLSYRDRKFDNYRDGGRDDSRNDGLSEEPYASREEGAPTAGDAAAPGQAGARPESQSRSLEGKKANPGTGWGDQSHDPVNRTQFTAEHHASDHVVLRYEYAPDLLALGIDVRRHRDRLSERERGDFGFAQPPRRR